MSHHPSHNRVLSEYNKLPKRDSDLTFDKGKKTQDDTRGFRKKRPDENNGSNDELHQSFIEIISIIDNFVRSNTNPTITLYVALKCYKFIER